MSEKSETGHFADDTFLMYGSKKLSTIETVRDKMAWTE